MQYQVTNFIEVLDYSTPLPYQEAEVLQRGLWAEREEGEIGDTIILLEHPPVFTMGRRPSDGDLKITPSELEKTGIPLIKTDRGGRITYHGPGQLVGYFIFALGKKTIPQFVREIEEILIRLLSHWGLKGGRDADYPGVWIDRKKVAALGLHFEKGISRHGFALNVDCDLKPFQMIQPCGIADRSVTSLQQELSKSPQMEEVKAKIAQLVSGSS